MERLEAVREIDELHCLDGEGVIVERERDDGAIFETGVDSVDDSHILQLVNKIIVYNKDTWRDLNRVAGTAGAGKGVAGAGAGGRSVVAAAAAAAGRSTAAAAAGRSTAAGAAGVGKGVAAGGAAAGRDALAAGAGASRRDAPPRWP